MRYAVRISWVILLGAVLALSACDSITNSTSMQDLETENAQLRGTIDEIGTPAGTIVALQIAATQGALYQNELNAANGTALAAQATLTVLELTGGSAPVAQVPPTQPAAPAQAADPAQPTSVSQPPAQAADPAQPTSTPAPPPTTASETIFSQTVVAIGRDNLDCPVGASAVIDNTLSQIYVITRINVLRAGSTIGARWYANGELFFDDVECWTPDQDWRNICAYCSIVPDNATFTTGNWSVELLLDGQLMAQTQFEVVDVNAPASGSDDGTGSDGTGGDGTGGDGTAGDGADTMDDGAVQ